MELTSSRSGAEISGGAVLVGIGIAAFLDLPPPWWSDMPVWLVRSGVTMGAILFGFGLACVVIGLCRSFPGHPPCKAVVIRWGQIWTRKRAVSVIFVAALVVFGAPFVWGGRESSVAQIQSPSQLPASGNCNNYGTNNGTMNNDCSTNNFGPPRQPGRLYQQGQIIGTVQRAQFSPDGKTITFTNLRIFGSIVDLAANVEFQGYKGSFVVTCPRLAESQSGNATITAIMINGTTECKIMGTNPASATPHDNTIIGHAPTAVMLGSDNTVVNDADSNGNVIHNNTDAIGSHACALGGAVAIGSHANAGGC